MSFMISGSVRKALGDVSNAHRNKTNTVSKQTPAPKTKTTAVAKPKDISREYPREIEYAPPPLVRLMHCS